MDILLAIPNPKRAQRLASTLAGLGHTLTVTTSPEEAATRIAHRRPEVALVGSMTAPWLEVLDATHGGRHIYRIALVGMLDEATALKAWEAGFDDVALMRAPASELAGRVAALDRIRGWLPTMGDGFLHERRDAFLESPVMVGLGQALAAEFGAMLGGTLVASRVTSVGTLSFVAEIPLTLASEGIEITLGVGITAATTTTLGTRLFGEPVGRDVLTDAMREFANTAGGLLKRSALDHGHTFSLGLPSDAMFPEPPSNAPVWALKGEGLQLVTWATQADDSPKRIPAGQLAEGMVLTQPVLTGAGVKLVPAGAVLTQRTVTRLLELIGPAALVEVARAA